MPSERGNRAYTKASLEKASPQCYVPTFCICSALILFACRVTPTIRSSPRNPLSPLAHLALTRRSRTRSRTELISVKQEKERKRTLSIRERAREKDNDGHFVRKCVTMQESTSTGRSFSSEGEFCGGRVRNCCPKTEISFGKLFEEKIAKIGKEKGGEEEKVLSLHLRSVVCIDFLYERKAKRNFRSSMCRYSFLDRFIVLIPQLIRFNRITRSRRRNHKCKGRSRTSRKNSGVL